MIRPSHPHLLMALLLLSVACARVDPAPDFAALRQDLSARGGMAPAWHRTAQESEAARSTARALLSDGMSAEDAVRVGLLLSPRLQATCERLGSARARYVQAGLIDNPVFSGNYRYSPGDGHVWELGIAQSLTSIILLPWRLEGAEADLAGTRAEVTGEILGFVAEVKDAYFAHQVAEARHHALARSADASDAAYMLAGRMRAASTITTLELLERRAVREEDRLALAESERMLFASRESLNRLLGLWGDLADWKIQEGIPPLPGEEPDLGDMESRAVKASLDLSSAESGLVSVARARGIRDITSVLGEAEVGVALEKDPGQEWARGPSWSIAIPLFDFGGAKRALAETEVRQALAEYEALAVEVRSVAREFRFELDGARQRAAYMAGVVLPLRRRLTYESQLQYNAMNIGPFTLIDAKREEYGAEARTAQALGEYWQARARLDALLAGRLPRDRKSSGSSHATATSFPREAGQ